MNSGDRYKKVMDEVSEVALKSSRDPSQISVIAVTKNHLWDEIAPLYRAGCRLMGENRLNEALPKIRGAPADISWHLIGTLQKNKVAKAVGTFEMIHSVDSYDLAEKISTRAQKLGLVASILLQVNTSGEESKHGCSPGQWLARLDELLALPSLSIEGLMTLAPLVEEERIIRRCFSELRCFKERLARDAGPSAPLFHLSMGMSCDYQIAIEEGATMLRIGTALFSDA